MAVGDGGDGIVRARVVEVILQVIVRAGKEPPRRAWILFVRVGPLEVLCAARTFHGRITRSVA